jgi:hypothetical protein
MNRRAPSLPSAIQGGELLLLAAEVARGRVTKRLRQDAAQGAVDLGEIVLQPLASHIPAISASVSISASDLF